MFTSRGNISKINRSITIRHCYRYVLTGKLWVVMGAGWFSELLSTLIRDPDWLWSVVDLINELQGLFIFLILVFKPKVFHLIKNSLGKHANYLSLVPWLKLIIVSFPSIGKVIFRFSYNRSEPRKL